MHPPPNPPDTPPTPPTCSPASHVPLDAAARAKARSKGKHAGATLKAVLGGRMSALVWVHVVCGAMMLLLGVVANGWFGWVPEFRLTSK